MRELEGDSMSGLFIKEGGPVPLTGVKVRGAITGRTARVTLTQRFENRKDRAIEAVYKFPLPESSSVCGFTVATGERILRGRVEEREAAFVEYDEALAQGHGAFLLDEERPNIFTLSVGNVKPRHTVDIEVSYVTTLATDGAEVRFTLPTTISPRYTPADMPDRDGIPEGTLINPELRLDVPYGLSLHLDIADPQRIAKIECPSHQIRTTYGDDNVAVEFSADTVKMDHDFVLTITYREGFKNRAYAWRDNDHAYLQLDFTPNPSREDGFVSDNRLYRLPLPTPEVIFLLDCSGSMGGPSIEQAKKALEVFLRGLTSGTLFNVYRFGSTFDSIWPRSVAYDERNLAAALQYLSNTQADLGGTELLAPLREIHNRPSDPETRRNIILITDGQVGNESVVLSLARSHPETRVFTVGIGFGPNEYLTKRLAALTGGATESVSPGERIEPKVLRLFAKVMSIPTSIDINWNAAVEQAPARPVVHGKECISLFARIPAGVPLPEAVTVEGGSPPSVGTWTVPVTQLTGSDAALPLLWARARISDLEEGVTPATGSRQTERKGVSVEQQLVALSKQYGIISRGTSFITVEYRTDAEKASGEIELRKVPGMLTRGWGGISGVASAVAPQSYALNCLSRQELKKMSLRRRPQHLAGVYPTPSADSSGFHMADLACECASPATELRADSLSELLALQSAGGGFDAPDAVLARELGLDMAETSAIAKRVKNGGADPLKLVWTAVMLALLQWQFASRRDEWLAVTQKSRLWFQGEVALLGPSVDGMPLADWAGAYVASLKGDSNRPTV